MATEPTLRFSNRVEDYVKYRPGYPAAVLDWLQEAFGLTDKAVIADVGSGTGIFSKLLLERGYTVYAVEPNDAMRAAGETMLTGLPGFHPVNGTAADTGLDTGSVDAIICAQAFHWFNNGATRDEFRRILKPAGAVALIWNNRDVAADAFAVAYDALLKNNSIDYNKVNHQNVGDIDFKAFFRDGDYTLTTYPNEQVFDEEGLIGRAYSSSYVPAADTEAGKAFLVLLRELFARYSVKGKVVFRYRTEIYSGKV